MSLITRCPDCGTMFKVVPDQLRISEGWVRCGQCSHVFDASAHMQAAAAPNPEDPADALPLTRVEAPNPQAFVPVPESADFGPSSSEIDEGLPSEVLDSTLIAAEAQALREHPLDQPFELRRQDAVDADEAEPSQSPSEMEQESELQDLAFVRKARRQPFDRRPRVRALMWAAVVALGGLLTLQMVLQDRDRLAASEPALRPWLAGLCAALNCSIGPHRQIDGIAIESSSFNKLRADAYRLQVTLKNQGGIEVALPALELTLTDGQDQAVIRRVLMPGELGARTPVIPAAAEWSSSVAIAVADEGLGGRIAGYRLLAFYP
jgi:predicted Zn finger-like uncharacterized protein